MADELLRERRGHVEILTINRPEARNALNPAMGLQMNDALRRAYTNREVRAIVLTGAGGASIKPSFLQKYFAKVVAGVGTVWISRVLIFGSVFFRSFSSTSSCQATTRS